MKISRIDIDVFETIRDEWNRLLIRSGSNSIFLTWEWAHTWWNIFGDEHEDLYILTAHDEEGRLIGIAPCYLASERSFHLFPAKEIRFLGYGGDICSEYLDFVTDPEERTEIIGAFFDYFLNHKGDWDILNFTDLRIDSQVIGYADSRSANNGIAFTRTPSFPCPYAPLPESWEEYTGGLSSSTRYDIGRKVRKLERDFEVNFYAWKDAGTLDGAIEKLIELHKGRWQQMDIRHSFSTEKFNEFHRRISQTLHELGLLRLFTLEADERILAMLYCFRYEDIIFYYQSGFDMQYSRYSPGIVIFAYAIQHAIAEKVKEFDFLRGDHGYKYHWAKMEHETARLVIRRNNLSGIAYVIHQFGPESVKGYLRRRLPSRTVGS